MIKMRLITYNNVLETYKSRNAGIRALSKYNHWFPLKLCSRVAGIVADLMADGHLQKSSSMWRMDYCSASKEELSRFNNEIKDLFGYSGYIRPCTTNTYGKTSLLAINCNQLGRVMSLCGVPRGSKVLVKFDLPKWIVEDKECFRRFLQRLFDCEGSVDLSGPAITLCIWKEESLVSDGINFFKAIKCNLEKHFNIKTTNVFTTGRNIRKDGKETVGIKIKVKRQAEIVKFAKEIIFETKEKQIKLNKMVNIILKKWANRDFQVTCSSQF